jgi:broad specificity phosphatase PhoE
MIEVKELYIIRHGETEFNRQRKVQGQGMDTDLNEVGLAQAEAFFKKYRTAGFDFVYTSRLKRSQQTVARFIDELQLPTKAMYELDEFRWGIFEGSRFDDFNADYEAMVQAWRDGDYEAAPLLGDAPARVAIRQRRAIADIQANPAKKILICMHGRAMRLFLCLLLDRPFSEMEAFEHANLSLYKVRLIGNKAVLELANDRSHLD